MFGSRVPEPSFVSGTVTAGTACADPAVVAVTAVRPSVAVEAARKVRRLGMGDCSSGAAAGATGLARARLCSIVRGGAAPGPCTEHEERVTASDVTDRRPDRTIPVAVPVRLGEPEERARATHG
ncbi:predicted protein [Streptomyces sp. C]|nr:predicted protein [Streptomyces sp. C]